MKKMISLVLCCALFLTSFVVASASEVSFGDSGNEQSLISTYNDALNTTLTRGMAAQLLYESAGSPAANGNAPFSDRGDRWANAIDWAYEVGILAGFGDGTCHPELPITRQQFAAMLWRMAGSSEISGNLLPYNDRGEVADWANSATHWCISSGVMQNHGTAALAPHTTVTTAEAMSMVQRLMELPDLAQLRTDLSALTEKPRPAASDGEAEAVTYLTERFSSMGYVVALQEYIKDEETAGHNIIAMRGGDPSGDILVISAHHDSVGTSFGANDNASGVAALLLVAEALKDTDTDTELRFISFTDEENGKNGSRQYVDSLPESERDRIVGCIQLDMLGGLGSVGNVVCTTDGEPNWLTDLLRSQDVSLTLIAETGSDHTSFQLAGIPSVMLTQNGRGYLYHSAGDTAEELNPYAIHRAALTVADAVKHIASHDTGSYQNMAQEQADSYVYRHDRQSRIFFSATRAENEAYLGFSGTLVDQWEESGDGWKDTYEDYQYDMGWFGGEKLMPTHYIYRNGYLGDVRIYPAEADYTTEQLVQMITDTHGAPRGGDEPGEWNWEDELYGKFISLTEVDGVPEISVYSYSLGISNTLATYEVTDGEAVIDDPQHAKVWELLCTALPLEHRQKIGQFQLFTDGFSNILAYTATMGEPQLPDNSHFTVSVDYYDVYDEYGEPRDWSKLLFTLIHEYGHVLLENDTQIDVSVEPDIHDPAGFIDGSFRQRYYEAFWQDPYSSYLGSYWEKPENYVSQYAGNMFHEDIADTFAVFVFSGRPDGDSIAEQKLRFFWSDAGMVSLREDIRNGLGLL